MGRRTGLVVGVIAVALAAGVVAVRTGSGGGPEARSGPASPSSSAQEQPAETATGRLLPNLRSMGASDLSIETDRLGRRLRFAASLGNLGPGPALVRPRRRTGGCPAGQLQAVQVVHEDGNDNGSFERRLDSIGDQRETGCMLDHGGHDHWHFDAMAVYSLRRPASEQPLVQRDKVSFCLRDNERVPGLPAVVRREHFGECTRNGPQGISPGWVDIYDSDLDGQWLRLPPGVRDEVLCLDLEADPLDLLEETDEGDNATSVVIRVDGSRVRGAADRFCG